MGGNCSALPDEPVAEGVKVNREVPRGVTIALPCGTGALFAEPPPQPCSAKIAGTKSSNAVIAHVALQRVARELTLKCLPPASP
jgi:hypothetical protein